MNPAALLTGAPRGIGRGIPLELAETGHDLVINFAGIENCRPADSGRLPGDRRGVAPTVRADLLDATEESFDRLVSIYAKRPFFLTQLVA